MMHLNQAFGDTQAQTGAAVFTAGGSIKLEKLVKEAFQILGFDS
jgi:hypothetical protein